MANGATHRIVAAVAVGGIVAHHEKRSGAVTCKPIISASLASLLTNLPDVIEPSLHPHHRQFFHSIAFAAALIFAGKQIYEWSPNEDWQKMLRYVLLIGGGAYLTHLVLDATTPRSIPLIGKL